MSAFDLPSGRNPRIARVHLNRVSRSFLAAACALFLGASAFGQTPAVGGKAPDFTLSTPTGKAVALSTEQGGHALVLVILRGFPATNAPIA